MESYFKILERFLCRIDVKSNRLKLDQFISRHARFIDSELKEALGKDCRTPRKAENKNVQKLKNTNLKVKRVKEAHS